MARSSKSKTADARPMIEKEEAGLHDRLRAQVDAVTPELAEEHTALVEREVRRVRQKRLM